ncbi:MAG: (Fe-S)-binding protein [Thermodesulfobacteriota bacterium]
MISPDNQCAKCGACSVVCPVWRVTGREEHTARGKLHLLGRLDPAAASETYAEILSQCLLCGACTAACPRGLDPVAIFLAARARLNRTAGEHTWLRATAQRVLGSPTLLPLLAGMGMPLLRRLPAESGMRLRLGLGPAPLPQSQPPQPAAASPHPSSATAACFHGCYASHLRPEIAVAVNRVVTAATGHPPEPIAGQCCCGLAAEASGDRDTAVALAKRNITAFADTGLPIVVSCASCFHQLRRYPRLLADDPVWRDKAAAFHDRLVEFSCFAAEHLGALRFSRPGEPHAVLCHDPCHLRFPKPATAFQRRVVAALPGASLTELPDGPQCCGQGGLFHLAHPETSSAIRDRLASRLQESQAQLVTTTCSGCLIQLGQTLAEPQDAPRPIHLALLLTAHL